MFVAKWPGELEADLRSAAKIAFSLISACRFCESVACLTPLSPIWLSACFRFSLARLTVAQELGIAMDMPCVAPPTRCLPLGTLVDALGWKDPAVEGGAELAAAEAPAAATAAASPIAAAQATRNERNERLIRPPFSLAPASRPRGNPHGRPTPTGNPPATVH